MKIGFIAMKIDILLQFLSYTNIFSSIPSKEIYSQMLQLKKK